MKHLLLLTFTVLLLQAMTLHETISYALNHNNALKQSDIAIERSKALRDNKDAQNYGRLDLMASYDHYNMPRTLAPLTPVAILNSPNGAGEIPTTKDMFITGLSYNVTLFDGFAQKNAYDISDLQYQNATIRKKLGREELIYNIRNLYISLLALEEQLHAQKIYTQSQEKLLITIEHQFQLGSKAKIDLLRAKNSLEVSRSQESSSEANIEILKATLSSLMGNKKFDKAIPMKIIIDEEKRDSSTQTNLSSLKRSQAQELNTVNYYIE